MWNTAKTQRRLGIALVVFFIFAWSACLLWVAAAFADSVTVSAQPDVLIVQHTYDGPIETAGTLVRWQYTGGHMLVEWVDTTADGIYRNGFE